MARWPGQLGYDMEESPSRPPSPDRYATELLGTSSPSSQLFWPSRSPLLFNSKWTPQPAGLSTSSSQLMVPQSSPSRSLLIKTPSPPASSTAVRAPSTRATSLLTPPNGAAADAARPPFAALLGTAPKTSTEKWRRKSSGVHAKSFDGSAQRRQSISWTLPQSKHKEHHRHRQQQQHDQVAESKADTIPVSKVEEAVFSCQSEDDLSSTESATPASPLLSSSSSYPIEESRSSAAESMDSHATAAAAAIADLKYVECACGQTWRAGEHCPRCSTARQQAAKRPRTASFPMTTSTKDAASKTRTACSCRLDPCLCFAHQPQLAMSAVASTIVPASSSSSSSSSASSSSSEAAGAKMAAARLFASESGSLFIKESGSGAKKRSKPEKSNETPTCKIASRIYALQIMFKGTLPSQPPYFISDDEWRSLKADEKDAKLVTITGMVAEEPHHHITITMPEMYDIYIHARVNYGPGLGGHTPSHKTRFRWWSDCALPNLFPIKNHFRNVDAPLVERSISLPLLILRHPYFQYLYADDRRKLCDEISKFFDEWLKCYMDPEDHAALNHEGFGRTRKKPKANPLSHNAFEVTTKKILAIWDGLYAAMKQQSA